MYATTVHTKKGEIPLPVFVLIKSRREFFLAENAKHSFPAEATLIQKTIPAMTAAIAEIAITAKTIAVPAPENAAAAADVKTYYNTLLR